MLKSRKELFSFSMAVTLAWGLIAHGYCFFNLNLSHDSLLMYQKLDTPAMLSVGRFVQPLYFFLRGSTYPPALVGFLSLVFIGAAVFITARLLEMEHKLSVCLLSGVMTVNSAVTLTNASYIHVSDVYALALLLAAASAAICRKGRYGFLAAILPTVLSLGLYQSYIQVAIFLHMMLAVMALLRQEKAGAVFQKGLKAVASLLISLIIYAVLYPLIMRLAGIAESTNYNSLADAGAFSGLGDVLQVTLYTVKSLAANFLFPAIVYPGLMAAVNVLIFSASLFFLTDILRRRRIRGAELALLLVLVLLMPFGINFACFLSKGLVHQLMLYSAFLVYPFAEQLGRLWQECRRETPASPAAAYLIPGLIALLLANSVIYSNQVYLKKTLEYDATCMLMNRILDRIEQTEGYTYQETPVAFVGMLYDSPLHNQPEDLIYSAVGLWHSYSVTYPETYGMFLNNVMHYPIETIQGTALDDIAALDEVQSMGLFPAQDSVKMVNGTIVVKLSHPTAPASAD